MNKIKIRNIEKIIIVFLLLIFFGSNTGCSQKMEGEDVVVAKVGDKIITVGDFRRNYEFGLPHLKKGADKKLSYLNYMINEEIIALEGYKLGYDQSENVQRLKNELLEELLIEENFNKEIHEKINITPEEIREAITKTKVSWKLRYWVEPSHQYAILVQQAMQKHGYSEVVSDILASNPEVNLKLTNFETDYLTWLDVPAEVLDKIKDLQRGEISEPIEMNGAYIIYQIVDIRRAGVLESDFKDKAASVKKILFYRKVSEEAERYVLDFMTPKNVVTKGDAFYILFDALKDWKKNEENKNIKFNKVIAAASENENNLYLLKTNLDKTLVTFKDGSWTIKDFLERFDVNSFKVEPSNQRQFRQKLSQMIALEVRNYYLINEAKAKGLEKLLSVKEQMQQWEDKWVYDETRANLLKGLNVTDEEAKTYFEKYSDKYKISKSDKPVYGQLKNQAKRDAYIQQAKLLLEKKINLLKEVYPVSVNHAVLDTITTLDSKKSRWMSLQVVKRSTNRMAVPIVDPAWGL